MIIICSCEEKPQDSCSTILSNTHYAPGTLGIDANPVELSDEISRIKNSSDLTICIELIDILSCVTRYPACSDNMKTIIPICESQCLIIDFQIAQCLIHLEDNMLNQEFPLVRTLLGSVECDEPETYYNFPTHYFETNSSECLMLGMYKLLYIHAVHSYSL